MIAFAGVSGDTCSKPYHGGPKQAVLLMTAEGIEELRSQGFPIAPGGLGENITTRGLERRDMRVGQRYRLGEAVIELRTVRSPCATLEVWGASIQAAIYDAEVLRGNWQSDRWGLSGFYASVIREGRVRAGDPAFLSRNGEDA
jgi:MOSC domain-containing protein YiiM